jgi:hypothetical protein
MLKCRFDNVPRTAHILHNLPVKVKAQVRTKCVVWIGNDSEDIGNRPQGGALSDIAVFRPEPTTFLTNRDFSAIDDNCGHVMGLLGLRICREFEAG